MSNDRKLSAKDAKALGAVLRDAREGAGLSREALSRQVGMSSSRMAQFERGGHKVYGKWVVDTIPGAILQAVAVELGTSADNLLADAGLPAKALPRVVVQARGEATNNRHIANAELVSLRIEAVRDQWEEFLRTLPVESKERFLMLLATGSVTTEQS